MTDFPYTMTPNKLREFMKQLPTLAVPPRVTNTWLTSIGFKSTNDRRFITVLRQLKFINSSNVPTDYWKRYRGGDSRKVLAQAIREGYQDLFSTYTDAHSRTEGLDSFFSTHSHAGKRTVDRIVATFRTLCEMADFSEGPIITNTNGGSPESIESDKDNENNRLTMPQGVKPQEILLNSALPSININIQLSLPETKDTEVYDSLFLAMKKHLFS